MRNSYTEGLVQVGRRSYVFSKNGPLPHFFKNCLSNPISFWPLPKISKILRVRPLDRGRTMVIPHEESLKYEKHVRWIKTTKLHKHKKYSALNYFNYYSTNNTSNQLFQFNHFYWFKVWEISKVEINMKEYEKFLKLFIIFFVNYDYNLDIFSN